MRVGDGIDSPFTKDEDREYLHYCLEDLIHWLDNQILDPLKQALRVVLPSDVTDLKDELWNLNFRIYDNTPDFIPSKREASLLLRAILNRRRSYVDQNEALHTKTTHTDILRQLEGRLAPIDKIIKLDWFRDVTPCRMPRLTDFLSIKEVYTQATIVQPSPVYDEKFGILLSPSQFLSRLALSRFESELRDTSVSVAFVDIDDFKSFNTEYGEFLVDNVTFQDIGPTPFHIN